MEIPSETEAGRIVSEIVRVKFASGPLGPRKISLRRESLLHNMSLREMEATRTRSSAGKQSGEKRSRHRYR